MQRAPKIAKVTERTTVSASIEDSDLKKFDRLICHKNGITTRSEVIRFAMNDLYQRTVAGKTGLILSPEH